MNDILNPLYNDMIQLLSYYRNAAATSPPRSSAITNINLYLYYISDVADLLKVFDELHMNHEQNH